MVGCLQKWPRNSSCPFIQSPLQYTSVLPTIKQWSLSLHSFESRFSLVSGMLAHEIQTKTWVVFAHSRAHPLILLSGALLPSRGARASLLEHERACAATMSSSSRGCLRPARANCQQREHGDHAAQTGRLPSWPAELRESVVFAVLSR